MQASESAADLVAVPVAEDVMLSPLVEAAVCWSETTNMKAKFFLDVHKQLSWKFKHGGQRSVTRVVTRVVTKGVLDYLVFQYLQVFGTFHSTIVRDLVHFAHPTRPRAAYLSDQP